MTYELRCHQFYNPYDHEVDSLEEAYFVANMFIKHKIAYPCDVIDCETGDTVAVITITSTDLIFWTQEKGAYYK